MRIVGSTGLLSLLHSSFRRGYKLWYTPHSEEGHGHIRFVPKRSDIYISSIFLICVSFAHCGHYGPFDLVALFLSTWTQTMVHPAPRKGMDTFVSFQNDPTCIFSHFSSFARVLCIAGTTGPLTLLCSSFRRGHKLWYTPHSEERHGHIRFISKRSEIYISSFFVF